LEQVPQAIPSLIAAMIPGIGPEAAAEIKSLQLAAKAATNAVVKKAAEDALENAVKRGTQSAIERGTTAAVRTAAVQQGADIGAGTYDTMYKYLIAQGATPEQAADQTLNYARAAGIGGGALSLLAAKLPGAQAFERALAGERTGMGRLTGSVIGAAKEIPSENVEEVGGRLLQNIAMKQVNPEQSLTEGLGQTAAQATIGAGGLGALGGIRSGRPTPETPATPEAEKPAEPVQKPLALGMSEPFVPRVFPDGSVATTPEDIKRYEEMQFEKQYAPQPTLAAQFREASRRATLAQQALRDGYIDEKQYNAYVAERDRLKQFYDAEQDTPERLAKYNPAQQEALSIAKEIEDIGQPGFADAMRAGVRSGTFREDSLDFYRQKLSDFKARKTPTTAAEEGAPTTAESISIPKVEPETRSLKDYFGDQARSVKRMEEYVQYAPQDVVDTVDKINQHIQDVTTTINNAGFKVNDVNSATAPQNVQDLKKSLDFPSQRF
jgi:hypothetical protein